jgi:hypothetical protein
MLCDNDGIEEAIPDAAMPPAEPDLSYLNQPLGKDWGEHLAHGHYEPLPKDAKVYKIIRVGPRTFTRVLMQ